ncbi:uncharacterized protein [Henckelia pumila]|uniref:uncharacterized protein n=1 Tax=Henckelia pumila TaxID=405737 RepID=UPI003C6DBF01
MCVDFRDLNKACPKDCYPLPRIDQLVDSTSGHELLCFLDAYQGYHQIPLAKQDQDKVSFVSSTGTYCYVVMPFGLKNAGAAYQRLMDKVFKQQIGKNIEVYVDDILVKTRTARQFIADLTQTFQTLRDYLLKLNPSKCTFGVQTGKFLGYMVTRRGIEANPKKVQAIISMESPKNIQESEKSFQELKKYLKELSVLNKPVQGEDLFVYLVVTPRAASSVLVRKEGVNHLPVYFVSHALKGAELNYMTQEKLALALVITARKLIPYFLSHPITVLTNSALGKIAANPDASERLIKWITELKTIQLKQEDHWKIFVDGSSCQTGSGVGIVIISTWGEETNISIRLDFRASNNEAEYEALLLGLKAARNLGISRATLYLDSQLAIQQSKGKFETKNEKMIKYAQALDKAKEEFTELTMELIPRTENTKADHLARLASSVGEPLEPGLKGKELVSQLESLDDLIADVPEGDWRYGIHKYLTKDELPNDNKKAREIKRRALRFVMVDKILFKRSFSQPLLKCLGPDEANYVLREIHEGCCGNHLGSIALARKALLAGFFWPTMKKDASVLVNSCYNCQRHANLQWRPAEFMKAVVAACPFDQWGMDIVGPFPVSTGNEQVEVTNRTIVQTLKTRLDLAKGKWVDELPSVLWSYRTTTRFGTDETPYNMVYGTEAVLPAEIGQESARVIAYGPDNNKLRAMDLDLVEENRARAAVRLTAYRKRMTRAYNKRVYPRAFQEGDLVMRKIQHHGERGKLDAKYEGPFKVVGKAGVTAYYLEYSQGKKGKRPWNAQYFKKYYS